jgi:hypothetical protein
MVYNERWNYKPADLPKLYLHPVLGMMTFLFALMQPIMAYFCPHPRTPRRSLFNWAHFSLGILMLMLASILTATGLTKAVLPKQALWFEIAFLPLMIYGGLEGRNIWLQRRKD